MINEATPQRRHFDEAFKQDAVKLLLQGGKSLKQLPQDLGVSHWNLRDWKRRYNPSAPAPSAAAVTTERRALRRENQRLNGRATRKARPCLPPLVLLTTG